MPGPYGTKESGHVYEDGRQSLGADSTHNLPKSDENAGWDLIEALYGGGAPAHQPPDSIRLRDALVDDLDGRAFGNRAESSTSSTPRSFDDDDFDIPHFPPLSIALLQGDEWKAEEENGMAPVMRTSEPIHMDRVEDGRMSRLMNREMFEELLGIPMGLVRFREWVDEEGGSDSETLLKFYEDNRAFSKMASEVQAVAHAQQTIYFDSPKSGLHGIVP